MPNHMVHTYQRYKSYEDFFNEIESWISKFKNAAQETLTK